MKILVIGSVNQDLVMEMDRIPKSGETLFGKTLHYFPGGKGANQAIAATLLKGDVQFVGKVGDDAFGDRLKKHLTELGIGSLVQTVPNTPTGTAIIAVDSKGENAISVIPGANARFNSGDVEVLNRFGKGDLLLVQNEINISIVYEAIEKAKERNLTVFYNPAPAIHIPEHIRFACDYIIVNEHELETCFDKPEINFSDEDEINRILTELSNRYGTTLILTLGSSGCKAAHRGVLLDIKGVPVHAIDTTGAGDCFCGALVSHMADGKALAESLAFANRAASLSVTRLGASVSFPGLAEMAGS